MEASELRVVAAPHPFKTDRIDLVVKAGPTVAEIVAMAQPDPALRRYGHVFVGDRPVPRAMWARVRPKPGVTVTVRVVPMGGGGGKNPLRIVLTIAVIAASIIVPHLLPLNAVTFGGAVSASVGSALISAGIPPGGDLLVNAGRPA